ncbi:MAG: alpha/beta hydrolase [Bacteroidia bacterium]|nr:alpha/beta hydrolase [Bacteroidia bacterium]
MLNYQYFKSDKKETLVLLHGFCENISVFNNQIAVFKTQFNLLCIDLPGFGLSNVIKEVTITKMADEVMIVIDYLKISDCVILGHSMGGYVTLAFAKKYSQILKGFGLIHSTAAKDNFERLAKRKQLINFIKKNGHETFFKTFFPDLFFDKELNKIQIETLIANANATDSKGIIEAIKAMMMREETFDVLKTTNLPVFFAIGKYDTIITEDDMFAQAAMCNQSEICYLEKSNHLGMIEEPTELNDAIINFVNSIYN